MDNYNEVEIMIVIPAQAGIQCFIPGFWIKSGMTESGYLREFGIMYPDFGIVKSFMKTDYEI